MLEVAVAVLIVSVIGLLMVMYLNAQVNSEVIDNSTKDFLDRYYKETDY